MESDWKYDQEAISQNNFIQYLWMSSLKSKLLAVKEPHFSKKTEPSEQKSTHSDESKEKIGKNGHEMSDLIQLFRQFFANSKRTSSENAKERRRDHNKEIEPRDRQIEIALPDQFNSQLTLQSLEHFISELCRVVWSRAFYYYSTNQLSLEHTKIYSSEQILKNLVRLSERYKLTPQQFEIINMHMQRKVLQYMLNKYPMTLSQEINRSVNSSIREIDNTDQLSNDYIYNSPVAFKYRETGEYNDLIMRIINEVLNKIDFKVGNKTIYEKFEDKMGRLFENIMDLHWMNEADDSDKESKDSTLHIPSQSIRKRACSKEELEIHQEIEKMKEEELEKYRQKVQQYTSSKIGRKLPDSTRPFTEEEVISHNIKIQNSQILRLLTKWCEELERKFTTPNYFAHYIETLKLENGKYVAEVPDEIKEYLDQLMAEEYRNIKHELVELANNNYFLQSDLLIHELARPTVSEIEKYECIASRYSIDVVHNLHSYIIAYLNRLIHGLLTVALKFGKNRSVKMNEWSSNLNLVTFQVMDILRCRCASGEKEILKVYNELIKMSENDSIKMVRVINRLKKGTNDILINIKYREILCQVQLAVTSKNNKFIEYSNLFNHYLYELKRSFFGPLTELCSIWKTLDSRFIYYYKIKGKSEYKSKIKVEHGCKSEREFEFFYRPFICSQCKNHYYHNNYIRHHIKCRKCLYWLCARCQIETTDTKSLLSVAFKNEEIIKNCMRINSKNQAIPEFGVCVFIQSQQLKVQPFRKHTNKNKTNIIGIKSRHLYEIYDISTQDKEISFRNSFLIFEISDSYGRKHIKIEDDRIKQFWIEETLRDVFHKKKERICLNYTNLTNAHLTKFSLLGALNQKNNVKKIEIIGNKIEAISTISTQYKNAKYLELSKNLVTNFSGIQKMEKLEKLFINENKLKEVPLQIVGLWNLKELSLAWNEIKALPDQLAKLRRLNILKLGNNKIEQFSNCLGQLFYLKQLSFKCNNIRTIPECIKSLNELTMLELQNNQISDIHENISFLVNLEQLNLSNNQILELPDSFMSLASLTYLNLCHNKLKKLPSSINSLFSLGHLDLSNNQLSSLPLLNKLHKLTELNLNYNILTDISELPQGLACLRLLSLSHNNLKQIPYIGFLENLQELYLNNNNIDSVHESIAKIEKLQILRLEHNNLAKICELKLDNLKSLNISQNKLATFCNMDMICLEELDLSGNFINLFVCNLLPSIKRINLANNKLESIEIMNNTKLRYIHLSYNQLQCIPRFNDRNHIKVLSLQHNLITSIPSSINFFHNLNLLNLSHNRITLVPKEMNYIDGIKERGIDLSQNPIERVECWDFLMRKGTKSTIQTLQKTLKIDDQPTFVKIESKKSNNSVQELFSPAQSP